MLPTLRKELPSKPVAAFDLVCSLPPLPLCGAVSDKTHVSFRTKCIPAAKGVAEGNITVQRERQRKEK